MVFTPLEFIGRVARLIPPPRKNVVRYYGALGPNSPLRPLVVREALRQSGQSLPELAGSALREAAASARAWAACISRVFEVDPLICGKWGERLEPAAVILAAAELARLMAHLGVPAEFPKTAAARSPPAEPEADCQVDPGGDPTLGIDPIPACDFAA